MTTVGYLTPNNVPVELIEAHGARAREIIGRPDRRPERGSVYMETFFDGHVQSIFDAALRGELADLDLLVIPRTSEGYLQLYYYLQEVQRWEPDLRLPRLHLFDLLQTPAYTTSRYVHSRVALLENVLSELCGSSVADEDLQRAIDERNEWRQAVTAATLLRRRSPSSLSGSTFLTALRSSGQMSTSDSTGVMRELMDAPTPADGTGRPRVLVKGSGHDDARIYQALERAGFDAVADDHFTGERIAENIIAPHPGGPRWALTEHYQRREISPRSYPQSEQDDRFIQLVTDSEADAVLFLWEENDDTLGWDYPEQRRRVQTLGIPHAVVRGLSYFAPDIDRIVDAARSLPVRALVMKEG